MPSVLLLKAKGMSDSLNLVFIERGGDYLEEGASWASLIPIDGILYDDPEELIAIIQTEICGEEPYQLERYEKYFEKGASSFVAEIVLSIVNGIVSGVSSTKAKMLYNKLLSSCEKHHVIFGADSAIEECKALISKHNAHFGQVSVKSAKKENESYSIELVDERNTLFICEVSINGVVEIKAKQAV